MKSARLDHPEIAAILRLCQEQQGNIVESQGEGTADGRVNKHKGTQINTQGRVIHSMTTAI
jgi:hypothetical protein